ncbi:unnamed protein product [Leptosia nina]|uniref:MD-2-related lipid-recognition domain-containing protein n=1 Tax=Leptosia nina TaxID=320188 RepID=A0AAV1J088_9NEOP
MFYFFILLLVASAQAKFYTDCGSKLASVQNVGVSGCAEDATTCILKRNTNVTISIDFTPTVSISSVETEAGEKQAYKATLPVLKSYPKVTVDVKWELKNDAGDDLVCVLIPAHIK